MRCVGGSGETIAVDIDAIWAPDEAPKPACMSEELVGTAANPAAVPSPRFGIRPILLGPCQAGPKARRLIVLSHRKSLI